ncbi:MAG: hypothetical protein Q8R28_09515 [Dehalococcoidia bacterium]|nr:hypothetical protein [Dehalococcoidia bacterium]
MAYDLRDALRKEGQALRRAGFKAGYKNGKPGLELPNGIFIESAGTGDRPDRIICSPVSWPGSGVEGAESQCDTCGGKVRVSPSSQFEILRTPTLKLQCIPCFGREQGILVSL